MTNLKYTALFGGGAIRGMAYVGVQRAIEELGIEIEAYGGASVGSIVAALLAVGYNADEMKDIFLEINFNLFKDIQLGIKSKPALSKGNVFLEWVRELIEKKGPVTFADLDKDLTIVTTNLSNFSCQEFSRRTTPDFEIAKAVRISCSMPGLMRPIEYDDAVLVDGDLQKSRPMWQLFSMPPQGRVLEFRLEGFAKDDEITVKNFANTVYSCMTAVSTSFVIDIYGKSDKYDYIVLDTGNIIVVDFNMSAAKRKQLIQLGYEQTMEYFGRKLPEKKCKILTDYKMISSRLRRIKLGEVLRSKHALSELFEELCVSENVIDPGDLAMLKEFRELFLSNIQYPALFGRTKLQNSNEVDDMLKTIRKKTDAKVAELSEYINNCKN